VSLRFQTAAVRLFWKVVVTVAPIAAQRRGVLSKLIDGFFTVVLRSVAFKCIVVLIKL
jgi:hypothetical protein